MFQSTPPRGGRLSCLYSFHSTKGFNPRPRVGGDTTETKSDSGGRVSIHAPAWGATANGSRIIRTFRFQSTPPRGGRQPPDTTACIFWLFQSTPPRGGRHSRVLHVPGKTLVSIHAPAWGATIFLSDSIVSRKVSIHAPAWGATGGRGKSSLELMFQSTPPRGGRRYTEDIYLSRPCFNPRPRVGGDRSGAYRSLRP